MEGNGWQWRRIEIDYSRYAHLPTHPLTHLPLAPAYPPPLSRRLNPSQPILYYVKVRGYAVTHALPRFSRRYFPSSLLTNLFRALKDRSNERNNPLDCERQEGNVESRNAALNPSKNIWRNSGSERDYRNVSFNPTFTGKIGQVRQATSYRSIFAK